LTIAEVLLHCPTQTSCHDTGKEFVLRGEKGYRAVAVRRGVSIGLRHAHYNPVFLLGGDLVV